MYCVNCGSRVSSSWNFCRKCGTSQIQTDDEADLRGREETSDVEVNPEDLHLKDKTDDDEANLRNRTATSDVAVIPENIPSEDKTDDDEARKATSGVEVNPEDIHSKDQPDDDEARLRSRKVTSGVEVNPEDIHSIDQPDDDEADLRSREATPDDAVNPEDIDLKDETDGANAKGSDEIAEDELFTEEEIHEFESVLEQSKYADQMKKLQKKIDKHIKININIAVSGSTGSGKSSLINTLRGLKANDRAAAVIGLVATTQHPTPYRFPNNDKWLLWDLPGVGSPSFPKDTYLKLVHLSDYDFVILVSSSRFTTQDKWLASRIIDFFPEVKLIFIRTKLDTDLTNKEMDRGNKLTDEEKLHEMEIIKDDIRENLSMNGIKDPIIFLVNNHEASEFEFGDFTETIVTQVSSLRQNAFIKSLYAQTEYIIHLKITLLRERMEEVSKQAAKAAVYARRSSETISEFDILNKEIHLYMYQLGINKQSVEKMTKLYEATRHKDEMFTQIALVKTRYDETMKELVKKRETENPSPLYPLQFIGRWLELKRYQAETYMILRNLLDACIEANKLIFNTVGQLVRR